MKNSQDSEKLNFHPPLKDLFSEEIERSYQARNGGPALKKVETKTADLRELQHIASKISPEYFQSKALSVNDLSNAFDLNGLTGRKICVAFIPLLDQGRELSKMDEKEKQNFLAKKIFLKVLFIDTAAQNLTTGFGNYTGYYFDLLPEEMQADLAGGGSTFTVDQKFATYEDSEKWFAEKYNLAKANLLRLLNVPIITPAEVEEDFPE